MKKISMVLLFVAAFALFRAPSFAQNAKIVTNTVSEGATAFLPVTFYDENNQPVIPAKVWFTVTSQNGTAMQAEKVCANGGFCTDPSFYVPNSNTFTNMNLVTVPCANRIEGTGNERNNVSLRFAYPSTCTLSATPPSTPNATPVPVCKYGTGFASYQKNDVPGLFVGKGATNCAGQGWAITVGCPVSTLTTGTGNVCTGAE